MDKARKEGDAETENECRPSKRRVNKHSIISCCAGHFPRGQCSIPVGLPLDNTAHRNRAFIFGWSQDEGIQCDCSFCTLFSCLVDIFVMS